MNKNSKNLALINLFLIPHLFNKVIFFNANRKKAKIIKTLNYNCHLGNITYKKVGSGKPIILLHSTEVGSSIDEFKNNIEKLSLRYTVYAINLLGYSTSDKPNTTYTGATYTFLLNNFIKDIINEPCMIIASGGSCSFVVKAALLDKSLYKKMILINPVGLLCKIPTNSNKFIKFALDMPFLGTIAFNFMNSKLMLKKYIAENIIFQQEHFLEPLTNSYYKNAHFGNSSNKHLMASYYCNYLNLDISNSIKNLNIPISYIIGDNNNFTQSLLSRIENVKKRNEVHIINCTRLLPHFENSQNFNQLVTLFFR